MLEGPVEGPVFGVFWRCAMCVLQLFSYEFHPNFDLMEGSRWQIWLQEAMDAIAGTLKHHQVVSRGVLKTEP